MAKITISNLCPTDSELLPHSEINLNDVSKNELNSISGGIAPLAVAVGIIWINRLIVGGALVYAATR